MQNAKKRKFRVIYLHLHFSGRKSSSAWSSGLESISHFSMKSSLRVSSWYFLCMKCLKRFLSRSASTISKLPLLGDWKIDSGVLHLGLPNCCLNCKNVVVLENSILCEFTWISDLKGFEMCGFAAINLQTWMSAEALFFYLSIDVNMLSIYPMLVSRFYGFRAVCRNSLGRSAVSGIVR